MQTPEERLGSTHNDNWSIRDEHIRARSEEDPPEAIFYLNSGVDLEIEVDENFDFENYS